MTLRNISQDSSAKPVAQHRIGIISDSHMPHFNFPDAVWTLFDGVDLIIHACDLFILAVIPQLEAIAPVVAIQSITRK